MSETETCKECGTENPVVKDVMAEINRLIAEAIPGGVPPTRMRARRVLRAAAARIEKLEVLAEKRQCDLERVSETVRRLRISLGGATYFNNRGRTDSRTPTFEVCQQMRSGPGSEDRYWKVLSVDNVVAYGLNHFSLQVR